MLKPKDEIINDVLALAQDTQPNYGKASRLICLLKDHPLPVQKEMLCMENIVPEFTRHGQSWPVVFAIQAQPISAQKEILAVRGVETALRNGGVAQQIDTIQAKWIGSNEQVRLGEKRWGRMEIRGCRYEDAVFVKNPRPVVVTDPRMPYQDGQKAVADIFTAKSALSDVGYSRPFGEPDCVGCGLSAPPLIIPRNPLKRDYASVMATHDQIAKGGLPPEPLF